MKRTFSFARLAHQLNLDFSLMDQAIEDLSQAGFIEVLQNRYTETEKLTNKQFKEELYMITNKYKRKSNVKTGLLLVLSVLFIGCASTPKGFILPEALSEVYRNGQLKPMEQADSAVLDMPNQWDRVSHTCTSMPIYDMYGYYVRTDVRCY